MALEAGVDLAATGDAADVPRVRNLGAVLALAGRSAAAARLELDLSVEAGSTTSAPGTVATIIDNTHHSYSPPKRPGIWHASRPFGQSVTSPIVRRFGEVMRPEGSGVGSHLQGPGCQCQRPGQVGLGGSGKCGMQQPLPRCHDQLRGH